MKLIESRKPRIALEEGDESRFCAEVCAYPLIEVRILLKARIEGAGEWAPAPDDRWPVRPCA